MESSQNKDLAKGVAAVAASAAVGSQTFRKGALNGVNKFSPKSEPFILKKKAQDFKNDLTTRYSDVIAKAGNPTIKVHSLEENPSAWAKIVNRYSPGTHTVHLTDHSPTTALHELGHAQQAFENSNAWKIREKMRIMHNSNIARAKAGSIAGGLAGLFSGFAHDTATIGIEADAWRRAMKSASTPRSKLSMAKAAAGPLFSYVIKPAQRVAEAGLLGYAGYSFFHGFSGHTQEKSNSKK